MFHPVTHVSDCFAEGDVITQYKMTSFKDWLSTV